MANQEHLDILKQGLDVWNEWRKQHPKIRPDLTGVILSEVNLSKANLSGAWLTRVDFSGADLSDSDLSESWFGGANLRGAILSRAYLKGAMLRDVDLRGANLNRAVLVQARLSKAHLSRAYLPGASLNEADLRGANLAGANLAGANLAGADLRGANLAGADLNGARLNDANLREADLKEVDLRGADLNEADLSRADLSKAYLAGADLNRTKLVECNLTDANLSNCKIYGTSAWNVKLQRTKQNDLVITRKEEAIITVDSLEVAQFVYLLLNNEKIRDVINTLTTKTVLILGRFTPERKVVLDALREALRTHGYLPILFDFEKPSSRNFTETVRTLAHLARFIIADLTDPSSIPQELQAIIPTLAVPVQPVLLEGKRKYSMFVDFLKTYHWVCSGSENLDTEETKMRRYTVSKRRDHEYDYASQFYAGIQSAGGLRGVNGSQER